jgi:hypothetical protein
VSIDANDNVKWLDPATSTLTAAVPVRVLATSSGVPDDLIRDALSCAFVDPIITDQPGALIFDAAKTAASGLKVVHLDRLERLLLVHEITHLSPYLIDLAAAAFRLPGGTDPLVIPIPDIITGPLTDAVRLGESLRLPLDVVLSWWGGLGLSWWGGLGGTIYLAHTHAGGVFESLASQDATLEISEQRNALKASYATPGKLTSIFGIGTDEVNGALAIAGHAGAVPLDLEKLSHLHRVLSLTKALGMSVADIKRFADYFQHNNAIDPLLAATPAQMLQFVQIINELRHESDFVVNCLAQRFGLEVPIVQGLMWDKLRVNSATDRPAIELFMSSKATAFADEHHIISVADDETALVLRLHKFSLLNTVWKLSPSELRWLPTSLSSTRFFQGLDINLLPVR